MKTPQEHPWVVVRVRLADGGWHNYRQTFATEAEARIAHNVPLASHEAVSQLLHWQPVEDEDGAALKLKNVDVRMSG